jgi:chemotaxis protein MotA
VDPSTLIALAAAWIVVFAAQLLDEGNPATLFTHPAPLVLVFGGALAAAGIGVRMSDLPIVLKAARIALLPKAMPPVGEVVEQIRGFAEIARREGLLSLEQAIKDVADPFLKRGLELVIDGTDPDKVERVLEEDVAALQERHKIAQGFFTAAGGYAPTLGIVGTVMGLIHVLGHLDDPGSLGPAIASAFLATLWGVASANIIWLPLAAKLKRITAAELAHRGMLLEGVLAIQFGESPSAVVERLKSHLSPAERDAAAGGKGGGKGGKDGGKGKKGGK